MEQAKRDYLPDARLSQHDWEELSDPELLALLLGPGNPELRAWTQALEIMKRFRTVQGLKQASYADLRKAGLGHRRSLALLAALHLVGRLSRQALIPGRSFRSSQEIFQHFHSQVEGLRKECFWDVLLDGKNRIMRVVKVSEGSLTSSLVHPREVFRPAIGEAAAAVLFVHNHPSGDPSPSQEDIQITRRLVETGKIVGIRPLDHVIIGRFRYFSFADQGLL